MKKILIILLLRSFTAGGQQAPALLNYQGRISNSSSASAGETEVDFEVRFWSAETDGVLLWGPQVFDGEEVQGHGPKVAINEGFFNLVIGPEDIDGRNLVVAFQGPDVYLEISEKEGPVIGSRQRVLSSGFSLKALAAETAVSAQTALSAEVSARSNGLVGSDGVAYGWEVIFADGDPSAGVLNPGLTGTGLSELHERVLVETFYTQLMAQAWPIEDSVLLEEYRSKLEDLRLIAGDDWLLPKYEELRSRHGGILPDLNITAGGVFAGNGIGLIFIPAGTFEMGSPVGEPNRRSDEIQHTVILEDGFWMGQYEVTIAQFRAFADASGYLTEAEQDSSRGVFLYGGTWTANTSWRNVLATNEQNPVVGISHNDANAFCNWLNDNYSSELPAGYKFSLPTEAQWEYSCRAGTSTPTYFGDMLSSTQANFNGTSPYNGAETGVFREETTPVGSFEPNPWGLYDMHGNAWEWCSDWYGSYPTSEVVDPTGPVSGSQITRRGGSWADSGAFCRSAIRGISGNLTDRHSAVGFRLAIIKE